MPRSLILQLLSLTLTTALAPTTRRPLQLPTACITERLVMLRNIDSCEALVFTAGAALDGLSGELRAGVGRLIAEAKEQGTLLALLEPADCEAAVATALDEVVRWPLRKQAPAVSELSNLRKALNVESPEGFGGSDGFGQKPGLAYGREPIAARCVVIVTSLPEAVSALGAGMRAVGIPPVEGEWVDEALEGIADACIDALGDESDSLALRVHDLSTPGAYWLNPAQPRDINGMRVDPDTGLAYSASAQDEEPAGEEDIRTLLQDVEPLAVSPPPSSPSLPPPPPLRRCPTPRAALDVPPAEAAAQMRSRGAILLDVRQAGEYRLDGHIQGSENIPAYTWEHGFYLPSEDFAASVSDMFALDTPLVLICADGKLARGAAAMLEAAAFTDVQTLEGGLNVWGWEAEDDPELPRVVVDEDGE
eukprot:CAMPEP_0119387322 /NCGR_PEP_ID=MMETSP1334-20130426/100134_1 /TAXON_ID=127549 /ORGANISM="Calcidiscus leptoporus, Strain RCC1130" /LENGTH=419 /DNA_ID=CAMNT_0007409025 /DNA_START=50 /DNA_END=1306 /DNA_ORIENTATION=-